MKAFDTLYIGGQWREPSAPGVLEVRSPHDRALIGTTPYARPTDVDRAVLAARRAFDEGPWPRLSAQERLTAVARLCDLHAGRAEELASLVTSENGSPLWFTRWLHASGIPEQNHAYLRAAREPDWEAQIGAVGDTRTVVRRVPVGVVAAVIPWNAPHQSALAKMVPALLAGCTVVLKASPETALDALALAEIVERAGFPEGVVSILPAGRETSEYLVSHSGIDKIAFTGSTAAGRRIASIAGQQLKRVSLELGGKSASIVLPDADFDDTVARLKTLSLANNGENCVAHTRILAPRSRYAEFVSELAAMVDSLEVGDPADPGTYVGPMVRAEQQRRVLDYLELGVSEGARVAAGGPGVPEGLEGGYYVRPTVFTGVDNGMRIAQEEIFGPVLSVIPFGDEDEAVRIAEDSPYGLGGGVWTADPEHGAAVARRIRSGYLTVNGASISPSAPFGGFRASGIGREFGTIGLSQYIEHQTIAY
ncbi:aldehyde dehydrogenase [Nocardiopsis exhalans]|uniref:Aldehyde dehydrogenase n=1 Tax=Nocardiopsis exhalans TaxID=163604 RepID=A0ABY5DEC7_9ACTN|nr:aldehyde dehydrogenase [Nocardiopsis exhalans]USY22290.1 aldehyde dehydrogenase [Nocardiopsis exhalans]